MKCSPATLKRKALEAKREARKLRELVHFLLQGQTCEFCQLPISPTAEAWNEHGNSVGPKFTDEVTIHHRDGNHENNARENKSLVHRACHKAHHLAERHKQRMAA